MTFETTIDEANQIRITTITGKITIDEIISKLKEIYGDAGLYDLPRSLWDAREAEISDISTSQIKNLADFVSGNWGMEGNKKTALVAVKDFLFGLARMYEKSIEFKTPSIVRVFHDYDEALTWLKESSSPSS